jgi:DNA-binding transcriptional LysR family regulator
MNAMRSRWNPALIYEHFPFLRQGIRAGLGLGLGLVPDYVVMDAIESGEVLTTLDDHRLSIFGTRMYLLYMPNRHQTRAVRNCIEFLMGKARTKLNHSEDSPAPL